MIFKKGDLIRIEGKEDAVRVLRQLNESGIGAVVTDTAYKYIRITLVSDDPEGGDQ